MDGVFTSGGLPPGRYQLDVCCSTEWRQQSLGQAGRENRQWDCGTHARRHAGHRHHDDRQAGVAVGRGCRDDKGNVRPGAAVAIFPQDRALWIDFGLRPQRLHDAISSPSGAYRFASLLPGEYFIVAVDSLPERSSWQEPAMLSKLSLLATRVRINANQASAQDLRFGELPR